MSFDNDIVINFNPVHTMTAEILPCISRFPVWCRCKWGMLIGWQQITTAEAKNAVGIQRYGQQLINEIDRVRARIIYVGCEHEGLLL